MLNFFVSRLCQKVKLTMFNLSFQGSPQWILLELQSAVEVHQVQIQFQGGFVGKECWLEGSMTDANELHKICDIHPKDDNSLQISFILISLPCHIPIMKYYLLFASLSSTGSCGRKKL